MQQKKKKKKHTNKPYDTALKKKKKADQRDIYERKSNRLGHFLLGYKNWNILHLRLHPLSKATYRSALTSLSVNNFPILVQYDPGVTIHQELGKYFIIIIEEKASDAFFLQRKKINKLQSSLKDTQKFIPPARC